MAIKTTTQQLEEVQAAITAVMANQSYSLAGVTYTRASLDALSRREEQLKRALARESGTRPNYARIDMSGAF